MPRVESSPLVSVIINNHNYGNCLQRATDSALQQDYSPVEVVVVDDGSTDNSAEVIRGLGTSVVPVFKSNGGQASAINAGFEASSGQIICLLDSDDIFEVHKVSSVVHAFEHDHEIGWVFHGMTETKNGEPIRRYGPAVTGVCDCRADVARGVIKLTTPATSALCFRRSFLKRVLPMPAAPGVEVSDAYLKVAALGLSVGYCIPDPLTKQIIHERNLFTDNQKQHDVQARILVRTAFHLRENFPQLRRISNKLLSSAMYEDSFNKSLPAEHRELMNAFLHSSSMWERFEMHSRAKYHIWRK